MPRLPHELDDRFGLFRNAWELTGQDGFITKELVGSSYWYIVWKKLNNNWEYLIFGTREAEKIQWNPLFGELVSLAGNIGQGGSLNLAIERNIEGIRETYWWILYWRRRGLVYIMVILKTDGPFAFVV